VGTIYGAQYEQALAAHPGDPVRAVEAFRRAGTSDAELRSVTRLACTTVADALARAASD